MTERKNTACGGNTNGAKSECLDKHSASIVAPQNDVVNEFIPDEVFDVLKEFVKENEQAYLEAIAFVSRYLNIKTYIDKHDNF